MGASLTGPVTVQGVPLAALQAAPIDLDSARQRLRLLIQSAQAKAQRWHEAMEQYEADYFLQTTGDTIERDDDSERVRLSDLADGVTIASAILNMADYTIALDRPGEREPDKQMAEAIESMLRTVLRSSAKRTGENVTDALVQWCLRLGAGVLHWLYIGEAVADNAPPLNVPPVEVYALDPRNFFPLLGGPNGQFRWAMSREMRSVAEMDEFVEATLSTSPEALALAQQEMQLYYGTVSPALRYTQEHEFWNVWGWERVGGRWVVVNALMYGTAMLRAFDVMEQYDHLPWALAAARDTHARDYERRWLPITYHARPHVRRAERLQGRMDVILDDVAQMPTIVQGSEDYPDPPTITGGVKNVVELRPGQNIAPPPFGTLPRDLYPQLDLAQRRIEQALLPPTMYGPGTGAASGYAFDQGQDGGKLRLIAPRDGLAFAMERMFDGIASLVARHAPQQPVYAIYSGANEHGSQREQVIVRGSDLQGWTLDVTWKATMPGDEMRRTGKAVQLRGLLSDERLIEELGIESPVREIETRLLEQVKANHPAIAEAIAFRLLQERGALPDVSLAKQQELALKLEAAESQAFHTALAAGATPDQAMQYAAHVKQQFAQAEMARMQAALVPSLQGMMQGQQVAPPQQQGGPSQPPTPDQQPQQGLAAHQQGGPPPGNPADPGAALRQLANALNPQ